MLGGGQHACLANGISVGRVWIVHEAESDSHGNHSSAQNPTIEPPDVNEEHDLRSSCSLAGLAKVLVQDYLRLKQIEKLGALTVIVPQLEYRILPVTFREARLAGRFFVHGALPRSKLRRWVAQTLIDKLRYRGDLDSSCVSSGSGADRMEKGGMRKVGVTRGKR
jgi:hypothetical protein